MNELHEWREDTLYPFYVPVEDWLIGGNPPGSIRECFDHTDETCIHGVPILDFGCPNCAARPRPRPDRRRWWRRLA